MGQGKDRLRIKQFSFLSETFSDLWIPRAIELLLGRKESVFDSCSIQNRFRLSKATYLEWGIFTGTGVHGVFLNFQPFKIGTGILLICDMPEGLSVTTGGWGKKKSA